MTEGPAYLTVAKVAQRLDLKPAHVRALLASGQLRGINVSTSPGRRTWRVRADALEAFEAGRGNGPVPKVVRRKRREPEVTRYY